MNTKRNNVRTIPQNLTVGALREMIAGMPDDAELIIDLTEHDIIEEGYSLAITDGKPMCYTIPYCGFDAENGLYNLPGDEHLYTLELKVEPIYYQ